MLKIITFIFKYTFFYNIYFLNYYKIVKLNKIFKNYIKLFHHN